VGSENTLSKYINFRSYGGDVYLADSCSCLS